MSEEINKKMWDILVIGAGPAGMAAAINARIREKDVLVLGSERGSSSLKKAPEVRNYPGLPLISGEDLMKNFFDHALELGAVFTEGRVQALYPGEGFTCMMRDFQTFQGRAVVLATGVQQARLLPGEKQLLGRGVSYCATCDAALFRGKDVAVIGSIPLAEEEADFLAGVCRKVYYLPLYKAKVNVKPEVEVCQVKPLRILGEEKVTGLELSGGEDLPVSGVFVIRRVDPAESLIEGLTTKDGAVVTGSLMETSVPGVFAAGDCTGRPYQVGKAVGEGLTAALSAVSYVDINFLY